jgi:hypothetical protein
MFVEVRKLDLMEGEEVLELGNKVMNALAQNRKKLKRSLSLRGIFNDHIVAKDTESGTLFRIVMKRGDGGAIVLGELEEVRQVYVSTKKEKETKQAPGEHECVCAKCGHTVKAKMGEECKAMTCPKCGAKMTKKAEKVEKSMEDHLVDASEDLQLLNSIVEIQKTDAEYIDLEDPDEKPKGSLFRGII